MHKNITLRLEEELLQKARHIAVDHNMSLSAWVSEMLRRSVQDEERYTRSKNRALKRLENGMELGGVPLTREEAHER